ncbi:BlaI/MecI/CopY family transcriptional regulator [Fundicoccus culcitae]|uniref:BlaI/MecI/CopY family transcriptional regulator n=1 Tax=Fundicoccus culcitae TaxID=2969821 RepID=A0ABY5P6W7_9LACT|nr:BlaI/MecI/CopY family transcriptional regulator [Fundicoccus culcitae]UUX34481.1 BlaI/MecI/CopY family transcriptional regulator [Fundicoccus culcitae]
MKKIKVTNKELEILHILWNAGEPLTANQMCEANPELVMSTVQTNLRNLQTKKLIKVADIVLIGKAFSRSYAPLMSQEDFILNQYKNINLENLMTGFVGQNNSISDEEISKIEALLEEMRKN